MCYAEVMLHGPSRDLHSGRYGGAALNPLNELVRILGDLHDADGRVHLPGFYDRVRPIAPTELESWRSLSFDEAAYLADVGLSKPRGEHGCSGLERLWGRPAADINGLTGGYGGDGAKTIIPTHGSAKVSFRLIPDQDPKEIFAQFRRFVEARLPDGARATFRSHTLAPGVVVPVDTPWMRAARDAFSAEFGRETVLVGAGGTIPAVHALQRVLGLDPLLVGVGLNDDQNHGPNEKFELACFRHGIRAHIRLLGRLAAVR
jgi:acetylornithine deacetylase/succinyl-diaminopimelate desuccinylase-like protein